MTSRRGRPRDPRVRSAVLTAVRDLLASDGYEHLTIEAVAARAGVAKQTVYRWWRAKSALVTDAVLEGHDTTDRPWRHPTGDAPADLRDWLAAAFDAIDDPLTVALIRGAAAAAADRDLDAERLYAALTGPGRDDLVRRLELSAGSGQVDRGTDLGLLADVLMGAVLFRVLARLPTPSAAQLDGLVAVILSGIAPPDDTRPSPVERVDGPRGGRDVP